MKITNIFSAAAALILASAITGCESEKEFKIIEGNLPIKTSSLYMVGNATPNGWSIDSPTPFTATEEDPLVFVWEGDLYAGEMKLCLAPGSWDVPFIRPLTAGAEIGREDISDAPFKMHAGNPDDKWNVTAAGTYSLSFDLRNWTMSTRFLKEPDGPVVEPIVADVLYIVGDATPNGWSIDAPTETEKVSDFIFRYEGPLVSGEMKACISAGSWDVEFIRPLSDQCAIGKDGAESNDFVYSASPDNKWKITDSGNYRLTFDLENWTIETEYLGEIIAVKDPIETSTLFMIGDATPNGWSMDDATELTVSPDNKYVFIWEGQLVSGTMKVSTERDGTFSCPFIRPSSPDCEISSSGVAATDFVYTKDPDDQWRVTEAGKYRLTFDLENWTIKAEYLGTGNDDSKKPIETSTLFMIGDATPNGWSMDDATELTVSPDNKYIFTWEGQLVSGTMKVCTERDGTFSCPFIRPSSPDCEISSSGVAATDFVYTKDPDDQWRVTEAGKYRLTFDLENWTIKADKLN